MLVSYSHWLRRTVFALFFAAIGVLIYFFVISPPKIGDDSAHARPLSSVAKHNFGISGSALLAMPADKQKAALQDLKSMGVDVVRFDIDWNGIQPNDANHYTWS